MTMFPLVCLLCLTLTVPNLALTYRLVRNRLFGSVFNLISVFMFLLTAVKTPLSVAIKLTLIIGTEHYHEFSCKTKPILEWIWGGSMQIGAFYAILFKYKIFCNEYIFSPIPILNNIHFTSLILKNYDYEYYSDYKKRNIFRMFKLLFV